MRRPLAGLPSRLSVNYRDLLLVSGVRPVSEFIQDLQV